MQSTSYPRKPYARKPQTPEQQLQSAIDRAERDHITVAGSGAFTSGHPFWLVASQSVQGMHHVVKQTGKSLTCDCIYSQMQHKVCVHRAAVFLFLKCQGSQPKQEAMPAPAKPPAVQVSSLIVTHPQPAAPARSFQADVRDQPDDETDVDYYASYASSYR